MTQLHSVSALVVVATLAHGSTVLAIEDSTSTIDSPSRIASSATSFRSNALAALQGVPWRSEINITTKYHVDAADDLLMRSKVRSRQNSELLEHRQFKLRGGRIGTNETTLAKQYGEDEQLIKTEMAERKSTASLSNRTLYAETPKSEKVMHNKGGSTTNVRINENAFIESRDSSDQPFRTQDLLLATLWKLKRNRSGKKKKLKLRARKGQTVSESSKSKVTIKKHGEALVQDHEHVEANYDDAAAQKHDEVDVKKHARAQKKLVRTQYLFTKGARLTEHLSDDGVNVTLNASLTESRQNRDLENRRGYSNKTLDAVPFLQRLIQTNMADIRRNLMLQNRTQYAKKRMSEVALQEKVEPNASTQMMTSGGLVSQRKSDVTSRRQDLLAKELIVLQTHPSKKKLRSKSARKHADSLKKSGAASKNNEHSNAQKNEGEAAHKDFAAEKRNRAKAHKKAKEPNRDNSGDNAVAAECSSTCYYPQQPFVSWEGRACSDEKCRGCPECSKASNPRRNISEAHVSNHSHVRAIDEASNGFGKIASKVYEGANAVISSIVGWISPDKENHDMIHAPMTNNTTDHMTKSAKHHDKHNVTKHHAKAHEVALKVKVNPSSRPDRSMQYQHLIKDSESKRQVKSPPVVIEDALVGIQQRASIIQFQSVNITRRAENGEPSMISDKLLIARSFDKPSQLLRTLGAQLGELKTRLKDSEAESQKALFKQKTEYQQRLTEQHDNTLAVVKKNKQLHSEIEESKTLNLALRHQAKQLEASALALRNSLNVLKANLTVAQEYIQVSLTNVSDDGDKLAVLNELTAKERDANKKISHAAALAAVRSAKVALMQFPSEQDLRSDVRMLVQKFDVLELEQNASSASLYEEFRTQFTKEARVQDAALEEQQKLLQMKQAATNLGERLLAAIKHLRATESELKYKLEGLKSFARRISARHNVGA